MDTLLIDLRYGARTLWRSKGLTLVAAVSLAVGIGANAAIFTIVNSTLLSPRPFARPDEIVELFVGEGQQPYQSTSWPSFLELRERNGVLTDLAAYSVAWQFRLGAGDDVEQVWGEVVSGNYFDVLGIAPVRGRTFLPEEDEVPNRNPVVVIGYGLWQRRFHGDPGLVGRTVRLNGQELTVVGIAPARYSGMMGGWANEVWVPTMIAPLLDPAKAGRITTRDSRGFTMVGRLKQGVSLQQARTRFAALTAEMQAEHPEEWRQGSEESRRGNASAVRASFISVLPESATRVHPALRAPAYGIAALFAVLVDLVLFIACMNLAGMLFARAIARRGEIGVRLALGAGRRRVVRQLLTESVLLSVLAGTAGILLAVWALDAVLTFMPPLPEGIRIAADIHVDWRVLAYTVSFATVTGVLFGLAPALHSSRTPLSTVLKDDSTGTARFRSSRMRMGLLVGQVAISALLLIGAGLVLRSLEKVRPVRLGYDSEQIVVAPLVLDDQTRTRTEAHHLYESLSDAVEALPGVRAVTLVEGMPGGDFLGRTRRSVVVEGRVPAEGEDLEVDAAIVGPEYFTHMNVPLVAGRDFSRADRDGAPCVAIVNAAFAERWFENAAAAVGKRLARSRSEAADATRLCEIIGVVRDDRWQSLQEAPRPFFALPLLQSDQARMTMLVHTASDPAPFVPAVRGVMRSIDPDIPLGDVKTLRAFFEAASFPFRLLGFVVGGCGLLALLLAAVGVYGAVSHSVAQRMREVGIRMALGALHGDVLRLVVGHAMALVGAGLTLGLLLGLALTRVLVSLPLDTPLLFGVSATDGVTFAGVALLLALVGFMASYLPARRATRADPVAILRSR